ncbi:hypothetical protein P153DRAFT_339313 [Dothidotthia symphoricarpi CBS 119687]|uniref:Polynucleotide 5'-hydroxyl-kinase GRC3 n=1 Tax=Dothidotthia symphoricarpi CBS 119687 TaxID=1392245 RepID=A0A6A6AFY0_9PLEO|nr:uncharacterized protein P153DRAFT_339313 [Dothidotthia symphoricarpi CBS 119687]KAF2129958.1 hypothetical protein P153DRAFT_339313 [Dothidotthia symphoricarpi CBS 119687]
MPGKRKRSENMTARIAVSKVAPANGKPLSAIAAARLRAEAAAKSTTIPETTQEPVSAPSILPLESSESEPEESEPEEQEPIVIQRDLKLCSWKNDAQDILSDTVTELTVNLKKHLTIALIGRFDLKVLRGAVNINGANIGAVTREGQKAKTYRVFVPATHPITKIRGLDGTNHVQFLSCKEAPPLAKLSPLFRDIWNVPSDVEKDRSFSIITHSSSDPLQRPLTPEQTPEEHLRAIETISSSPSPCTTLIAGPASTGKSTFARRLTNRYLTGLGKNALPVPALCYLDLDAAKPEYTPPGQISLIVVRALNLGPGFTHPLTRVAGGKAKGDVDVNETVRAHPIPADLANYEDYFRQCIEDLFLACKTLQAGDPSLPLVINTPGSMHTSRILADLVSRAKPHHIVRFTYPVTSQPPLPLPLPTPHTTTHTLPPVPPSTPQLRTPSHLSTMHTQSAFHTTSTSPQTWSPTPLSALPPYTFHYTPTLTHAPSLSALLPLTPHPIPSSSIIHALNGALIHLLLTSPPSPSTLQYTPKSQIPFFPPDATGVVPALDPRGCRLLCVGLVVGVEPGEGAVRVFVPRGVEGVLEELGRGGMVVGVLGCGGVGEWAVLEGVDGEGDREGEMPVWVQRRGVVEGMGYLNCVRRVRKFIV